MSAERDVLGEGVLPAHTHAHTQSLPLPRVFVTTTNVRQGRDPGSLAASRRSWEFVPTPKCSHTVGCRPVVVDVQAAACACTRVCTAPTHTHTHRVSITSSPGFLSLSRLYPYARSAGREYMYLRKVRPLKLPGKAATPPPPHPGAPKNTCL